jgi:hypothetical protein
MEVLIAKILCVAYLALGIGILTNPKYYKKEMENLLDNSAILLFGGFIAIILGFIIIEYHNTWEKDWTTIITLVGWIAILKGVTLLAFPHVSSFYKNTIFKPENFNKILLPILIIMGIVFGYFGFFK